MVQGVDGLFGIFDWAAAAALSSWELRLKDRREVARGQASFWQARIDVKDMIR